MYVVYGLESFVERDPECGEFCFLPEFLFTDKNILECVAYVESTRNSLSKITNDVENVVDVMLMDEKGTIVTVKSEDLVYLDKRILKRIFESLDDKKAIAGFRNDLIKMIPDEIKIKYERSSKKMAKQLRLDMEVERVKSPVDVKLIAPNKWSFEVQGKSKVVSGIARKANGTMWISCSEKLPYKHFMWIRRHVLREVEALEEVQ